MRSSSLVRNGRMRMSEVGGQGRGTDGAAVVKLDLVGLMGRSNLTVSLQSGDSVDERRVRPGFDRSLGLGGGDDVCGGFFDYAEAVEF